jgi:hypothetical protein
MTSSFPVLVRQSPSPDQPSHQSFRHRRWLVLSIVASALLWSGTLATAQSPVLNDFACRQVATRELAEIGPALTGYARDPRNLAPPGGIDGLGLLLPAIWQLVEARDGIAIEPITVQATHIGGTEPQRTCRVVAKVKLGYTRIGIEPDLNPATTTVITQRPQREAVETEVTYDVTFAGSGVSLQIIETVVGAVVLQALASDAGERNAAAMTAEARAAMAEKNRQTQQRMQEAQRQAAETDRLRRQEQDRRDREARQAEFDAQQRQREAERLAEEQRQREIAAEQDRQSRVLAEEARRRAAAQREREEAQNRLWRLERLRGMLASAEDRLARLEADEPAARRRDEQLRRAVPGDDQSWRTRQREQDVARQRARVEELRAEIAREEGTGQSRPATATAPAPQAGADTPGPTISSPAAPAPIAGTTPLAVPPIVAAPPTVNSPPSGPLVPPVARPEQLAAARPMAPVQPPTMPPSIAPPPAATEPSAEPPNAAAIAERRAGISRPAVPVQTRIVTMRLQCGPFLFGANRAPGFIDEVRFTVTGDRLQAERQTGARPGREIYEGRMLANGAIRITGRGGYDNGPNWRLAYEGAISRTATNLRGVLIRRDASGAERVGRRCSLVGAAL